MELTDWNLKEHFLTVDNIKTDVPCIRITNAWDNHVSLHKRSHPSLTIKAYWSAHPNLAKKPKPSNLKKKNLGYLLPQNTEAGSFQTTSMLLLIEQILSAWTETHRYMQSLKNTVLHTLSCGNISVKGKKNWFPLK